MSMIETVRAEMMAAMKAKDAARKGVLSGLLSALKAAAIDKRADLTGEEELAVVSREAKQTRETLESTPADRTEILEECRVKLSVLGDFLPAQMDEAEIRRTIEETLAALGLKAPTTRDKGVIMKELMPRVRGKAEGKQVNAILATYLA
ncbi:MAG: GatB/YqeY domain-containing protein [Intestinibacillus sp.]